MKVSRPTILLGALPLCLVALSWIMDGVRGPYDLGENIDPSCVVLFNSLNLATGKPSFYFQHPATTVQILSAVTLVPTWLSRKITAGAGGLAEDVVSHHVGYLKTINVVHVLLLALAAFFAGWTAFRVSGSCIAALVVQATPLMFLTPIEALPRVTPELMEVIIEFALVIPLAPLVLGRDPERASRNPLLPLAAGALVGAGVATKANFFTVGLLVLLFPGWKQKLRFVAAVVVSLGVLLAPLVFVWRQFVDWYFGMATRSGLYGAGEAGLPSAAEYLSGLGQVYREEPFLLLLSACYVTAAGAVHRWCPDEPRRRALVRALLVGPLIVVVHTLVTAKHFNYHYVLPALLAAVLLNAVLVTVLQSGGLPRKVWLVLLLLVSWAGYEAFRHNLGRMRWYAGWKREYREQVAAVAARRNELGQCRVAGYYRSSAPTFALRLGNDLAGQLQQQALERVYPGQVHVVDGSFRHWDHRPADGEIRDALRAGQCILVQGNAKSPPQVGGFVLEPVYQAEGDVYGAEALFRLALADSSGDSVQ